METPRSVIGTYTSMRAAEAALDRFSEGSFPLEQMSVVAKDLTGERQVHGFVKASRVGAGATDTGVWLGGLFGVLMGAAFLWVPGFGPLIVAGPFAAALLGCLERATVGPAGGGLLGALTSLGVPRAHISEYEEAVRRGHYLLIVHGTEGDVARARAALEGTNAADLNEYAAVRNRGLNVEPSSEAGV